MVSIITFPNEPMTFIYNTHPIMYYYENKSKIIIIGAKLDYRRRISNFSIFDSIFDEDTFSFYEFDDKLYGKSKELYWKDIILNVEKILKYHKISTKNIIITTT